MSVMVPTYLENRICTYAELIAERGLNIQPGQLVFMSSPVECAEFARIAVKAFYDAGASRVHLEWTDSAISRETYTRCPIEEFETYPSWTALMHNELAQADAAYFMIDSDDPNAFAGVAPSKMQATVRAAHRACETFYNALNHGKLQWCIAGVPNVKWARQVFPAFSDADAVARLWENILAASRIPAQGSAVDVWEGHEASFEDKKAKLNSLDIVELRYANSLGTDFSVRLPQGAIWHGGSSETVSGISFSPNIPTEEIYTSPDKDSAEGVVYASAPLIRQGNVIEGLWMRFHEGEVVEWGSSTASDVLDSIIETDEGSHRLGEVALVPYTSPIRNSGILFWDTLFDENASCHVAVGASFAECIEGGLAMTREELDEAGLNDSMTHVDFMIGTEDLDIDAVLRNGNSVRIFESGEWAI